MGRKALQRTLCKESFAIYDGRMGFTTKEIRDAETLRAIAHPLRMRLLGRLRAHGPATASELGRSLGESSGSTSYHLRQLERYGFVVDDDEQSSKRERRWKSAHDMTSFRPSLLEDGGGELMEVVKRQMADHLFRNVHAYLGSELEEPWKEAFGSSDYFLRLTAEDARRLGEDMDKLVESYLSCNRPADDPDARALNVHALVLPHAESNLS